MADSFVFYESWLDIYEEELQGDEEKLQFLEAIVFYGIRDEVTEFEDRGLRMITKQVYAQIDAAQRKRKVNRENGKQGGRPRKNRNETENNRSKTENNHRFNNVNGNGNVNANANGNNGTSQANCHTLDANDNDLLVPMAEQDDAPYWETEGFDDDTEES